MNTSNTRAARARALVISAYPLTKDYAARLSTHVGEGAEFSTAALLRQLGIRGLVSFILRRRRAPVFIASETEKARALEPALAVLGVAFKLPPIHYVRPSGESIRMGPASIVRDSLKLLAASVDCIVARRFSARVADTAASATGTPTPVRTRGWSGCRILYIKNTMSLGVQAGGSVGHVAGVVNALTGAGAELTLVTNEPSPMIRKGIREVHPEKMQSLGLPSQANIFRMQRQTIRLARAEAARYRPSLIYQRLTLGDCSGAVLSRELGIPLIVEYNGSEIWCNRNWGAGVRYLREFQRAEEAMLGSASFIFTVSRVLHDELLARGIPKGRVGWYPNGIDPAVFDPSRFDAGSIKDLRESLGIGADEFVVTFVGTFGDWHGAEVFARAAIKVFGSGGTPHGRRMRFLFIGDGKNRALCQSTVDGTPAAERCLFLGLVPQAMTPRYLAASDCFVSPHVPNPDGTEFFGSPTKLFEYMAMGKPIIASRLGQIADVLDDGQTAVMVEPGDAAQLAEAILRVRGDHAASGDPGAGLGANLGAAARRVALERFTWDAHVNALLRQTSTAATGQKHRVGLDSARFG
jgi:glycosyltransferase involved in cell wall biosynthesis